MPDCGRRFSEIPFRSVQAAMDFRGHSAWIEMDAEASVLFCGPFPDLSDRPSGRFYLCGFIIQEEVWKTNSGMMNTFSVQAAVYVFRWTRKEADPVMAWQRDAVRRDPGKGTGKRSGFFSP